MVMEAVETVKVNSNRLIRIFKFNTVLMLAV
jgi:hypothetical protein